MGIQSMELVPQRRKQKENAKNLSFFVSFTYLSVYSHQIAHRLYTSNRFLIAQQNQVSIIIGGFYSQIFVRNDQQSLKGICSFQKYQKYYSYNQSSSIMIKCLFQNFLLQNPSISKYAYNFSEATASIRNVLNPIHLPIANSNKIDSLSNIQNFNIPGLYHYKNFLSSEENNNLFCSSLRIYDQICHNIKTKNYQLKSYTSPNGCEVYKQTSFHDLLCNQNTCKKIKYYNNFKGEGHDLAYFIGNRNIPAFITSSKIISQFPCYEDHCHFHNLNWRSILNIYTNCPSETAFDWHKDVEANGPVTYIVSLYGRSYLDMRRQSDKRHFIRVLMQPGSLLVLSGQSRYDWEHRVVRIQDSSCRPRSIERISIVLGYNFNKKN